jgi:hypothetical protein
MRFGPVAVGKASIRARKTVAACLALFLGTAAALAQEPATATVLAAAPAEAPPPPALPEFARLWDGLLRDHVKPGQINGVSMATVDYAALKADARWPQTLDALAKAPEPAASASAERMAYWINAYNILAAKAVVEAYPIESITKIEGVWDKKVGSAAGREVSLNEVEHQILRPMGDPRVHAALNCASLGCPPLRREAFVAARLDEQLADQTRVWLNDPNRGVRVREGDVVVLSELFNWFGNDFAPDIPGRLRWISRFLRDPAMREAVTRRGAKVESIPWDWRLNQQ